MIPVNKQLPVGQVGKCIERIIIISAYFEAFLILGESGDKLSQQADAGKEASGSCRPCGQAPDEISPAMSGIVVIVHGYLGYQMANLLSFFLNYLNTKNKDCYF